MFARNSKTTLAVMFVLTTVLGTSSYSQQDGGTTTPTTGGFTGGNATANEGFQGLELGADAFGLQTEVPIESSLRFEIGYVGPTGSDIDGQGEDLRSNGYIGQRNENLPTGGLNDSITLGSTTTTGRGGAGAGVGGLGAGTSLYFEVQRRGVRARLRPAFSIRAPIESEVVSQQFVSLLGRLPATREINSGYNISVANKTATITGAVGSIEESKQIERQLRFEPGVYRIINNLQVQQ